MRLNPRTAILDYEPRKEPPLTVAEADRMLSDPAKGRHLEVRVEGGKLLYGL